MIYLQIILAFYTIRILDEAIEKAHNWCRSWLKEERLLVLAKQLKDEVVREKAIKALAGDPTDEQLAVIENRINELLDQQKASA